MSFRRGMRILRWIAVVFVLIVVFFLFGLPALLSTEGGRNKLASVLGDAIDREVGIGGLDVGFLFGSVDLEELSIGNPKGFPKGRMLEARRVHLDASLRRLLAGSIEGTMEASGVELHVLVKDGRTNLDGLGGSDEKEKDEEEKGEAPELHLVVRLTDSRVTLEDLDKKEKVVVDGVDVDFVLSNRGGEANSRLTVHIDAIDQKTLRLHDIRLDAFQQEGLIRIRELSAEIANKGRVVGSAQLSDGDAWQASLRLVSVGIDEPMQPFVAALYPPAAAQGGPLAGTLDGEFNISGRGLTWEEIRPTLEGTGEVKLSSLNLPAGSLISMLAQGGGRGDGTVGLFDAGALFDIKDGWFTFHRLSASGEQVRYDLSGRVSLTGDLDLKVDLKPAALRYGGGQFEKYLKYVDKLDFRIKGNTDNPKLRPPRLDDLLRDAAGGALGDLLDRLK